MTHPRGFSVTEPSVAAVVGSLDSNTARYAARIRLQGHRIEIIQARAVACDHVAPDWLQAGSQMGPYGNQQRSSPSVSAHLARLRRRGPFRLTRLGFTANATRPRFAGLATLVMTAGGILPVLHDIRTLCVQLAVSLPGHASASSQAAATLMQGWLQGWLGMSAAADVCAKALLTAPHKPARRT